VNNGIISIPISFLRALGENRALLSYPDPPLQAAPPPPPPQLLQNLITYSRVLKYLKYIETTFVVIIYLTFVFAARGK
jgi:hypothetical protein